ncbi:hypothetical protein IX53_00875 [Kosmotoga pacifica]|uniref:Uncharacterized protein n=1 Tax=Kosmotoga pacifica TaxID=1330330 RepID=A0A0G2ZCW8_9BACT|nr:hypothetical protein IX53_00875 [Kosmotoga pacifica]
MGCRLFEKTLRTERARKAGRLRKLKLLSVNGKRTTESGSFEYPYTLDPRPYTLNPLFPRRGSFGQRSTTNGK